MSGRDTFVDGIVSDRAAEDVLSGVFTAEQLMAMELPEVKWVVPDILPEGVTLLAGKPKMGKSWMAYGLAVAVASGGVALGTKHVERGEVLYLALEDNHRRLQKRLKVLLGDSAAPAGLNMHIKWPTLDDGGAAALHRWLRDHPDTRLVVVDTLKKVRPRTNGQRGMYDVDYEALEPLLPLAAEHGVAILVVHHLRKMDADDPMDAISGSTGLTGGVDGILVLKRDRIAADAFLLVDGRDIEEPAELALKWDRNLASWAIAGSAEDFRLSEGRREIVELLGNAEEPMSARDVAIAIGKGDTKGYDATRQMLYQMSRTGEAGLAGRGLYALPNNPNNPNSPNNPNNPNNGPGNGTEVVRVPKTHPNNGTAETPVDKPNVRNVRNVRSPCGEVEAAGGGQAAKAAAKSSALPEDVIAAEMRRSNSGAAKNLPHFLAGTASLEILTKSVLRGLGKEGGWLAYAEAVEKAAADPANHPVGCVCGECS
jgi:hypothetical protein